MNPTRTGEKITHYKLDSRDYVFIDDRLVGRLVMTTKKGYGIEPYHSTFYPEETVWLGTGIMYADPADGNGKGVFTVSKYSLDHRQDNWKLSRMFITAADQADAANNLERTD